MPFVLSVQHPKLKWLRPEFEVKLCNLFNFWGFNWELWLSQWPSEMKKKKVYSPTTGKHDLTEPCNNEIGIIILRSGDVFLNSFANILRQRDWYCFSRPCQVALYPQFTLTNYSGPPDTTKDHQGPSDTSKDHQGAPGTARYNQGLPRMTFWKNRWSPLFFCTCLYLCICVFL